MEKRCKMGSGKDNLTQSECGSYANKAKLTINSLPPEILINILGYLSSMEKIKMERVCKHWQSAAQKSWHMVRQLSISMDWGPPGRKTHLTVNRSDCILLGNEILRVLQKIVLLCGHFVKEVSFRGNVNLDTVTIIRKNCANIVKLDLSNMNGRADNVLGSLLRSCVHLSSLSMDLCTTNIVIALKQLSRKRIKCFELRYVSDECDVNELTTFIRRLKRLETLRIPMDPIIFETVAMKKTLTTLYLDRSGYSDNMQELYHILELSNLQTLGMSDLEIADDFFMKLVTKCKKLEYLDITENNRITKKGLDAISCLPKLDTFYVDRVSTLTDGVLVKFCQVTRIDCTDCGGLTGRGYLPLVNQSTNLETLYISYKREATEEFLKAALNIVTTRDSEKVLTIGFRYSTEVLVDENMEDVLNNLEDEFNGKSDFLKIDFM